MKMTLTRALACLVVAALFAPCALAGGCWYRDLYGEHDFEQTGFAYPTCTADGYYIIECRQCGLNETHITGKATGHTAQRVPAKSVPSTCIKSGYDFFWCSECDQTWTSALPKTAHAYGDWRVTNEATDHSAGERARECAVCGYAQREAFYPEGTLYRGIDDTESVRALQETLIELGLLEGGADGKFGKKTEAAVKSFQEGADLAADGVAWPQTLTALRGGTEPRAYCETVTGDDGAQRIIHCDAHARVAEEAEQMSNAEERRALWQTALDDLYDEWLESADEDERGAAASAKVMFAAHLKAQEAAWSKKAGVDSDALAEMVAGALRDQCAELCFLLHAE